jgi:hypothetical protein
MHHSATRRSLAFLVLPAVAALLITAAPRVDAQVNPLWDHYKLYLMPPLPMTPPLPVQLTDQFGSFPHHVEALERYMNPTEKTVFQPPPGGTFPVNDPLLHYSWWRISPVPFAAFVTAVNQFGDFNFNVRDGIYLLNPSVKNDPGTTLPPRNHYKCYDCDGPPVNFQVRMFDQFGPWEAIVGVPRYFCNPVEKQVSGAPPNPIVDLNQHYVCYEFQPEDPNIYPATITDQFITNLQTPLGPSRWLCVPTYKTGVTENRKDTWGKLKQLYR